MDKFFSNLTGGGDKKKPNNNHKKDDSNNNGWQGGRSGDMSSINKNAKNPAARIGGGGSGNGNGSAGGNTTGNKNVFANAGAGINDALGKIDLFNNNKKSGKNVRGGGQSLGGAQPGRVFSVSLEKPGALGMEVERRKNSHGTTIIAKVVPQSQAEEAGLQRGDVVCYPLSNGEEEIQYDQFLEMAKSGRRPLRFDVRRIGIGGTPATSGGEKAGGGKVSADAEARKQAMIAAAVAREAKHKAKTKPVPKSSSTDRLAGRNKLDSVQQKQQRQQYEENDSEETRRAIAAIKQAEKDDAVNLGYNPYESKAMTSGQARTATVVMTKGEIQAENVPPKLLGSGNEGAPGRVNAPTDPTESTSQPPNSEFDHAYTSLITSNDNNAAVLKSMGIMRKLIINATTKGQQGNLDDESSSKFRRVRLSNPKIKEVITDLQGALELMMTVGFQLSENEDDGETYLVFPPGERGPLWLSGALQRMEAYENGGSS